MTMEEAHGKKNEGGEKEESRRDGRLQEAAGDGVIIVHVLIKGQDEQPQIGDQDPELRQEIRQGR